MVFAFENVAFRGPMDAAKIVVDERWRNAAENTGEYPFSAACIIAVATFSNLSSTMTFAILVLETPSMTRTYFREQSSFGVRPIQG